jgi:branched-chain amino acid transport system permease protein
VDLFIQQCINGLSLGAVYAIFAIGFGLLFSTTGVLNFAQGLFATWACIVAYFLVEFVALPLPLAIIAGLIVAGLMGLGFEVAALTPLRNRGGGVLGPMVASIAIWIALLALAEMAIGQDARPMHGGVLESTRFTVGAITIRLLDIIAIVLAFAIAIALQLVMTRTRLGLAIRAVSWSERSARVAGIDAKWIFRLIIILSAVITAVAGMLDGFMTGSLTPQLGDGLLIIGFAAAVVGGVGDLRGSLIAGFAFGLLEVLSAQYIGASYRDAIVFGLLLVFLVVRPNGIFGRVQGVRA